MLSRSTFSNPNEPWSLHSLWTMGHTGIVRSCLWDEEVGQKFTCKTCD